MEILPMLLVMFLVFIPSFPAYEKDLSDEGKEVQAMLEDLLRERRDEAVSDLERRHETIARLIRAKERDELIAKLLTFVRQNDNDDQEELKENGESAQLKENGESALVEYESLGEGKVCPPGSLVRNMDECKAALIQVIGEYNMTASWEATNKRYPDGCFIAYRSYLYVNDNDENTANPKANPLCIKEQPTA